jgi:hypothetical protein
MRAGPKPQAELRFELSLNGKPVATAGVNGYGVFTAYVIRVKHDPSNFERVSGGPETIDEWSVEQMSAGLGGGERDRGYNNWGRWGLKIGDEVTIRILGAGDADPPAEGPDANNSTRG